jgi:Flp pilus assembly protein CpaB
MDMRTATVMTMGFNAQEASEILTVADQNDPLRLALREPSDELIERLCALSGAAESQAHEEFARAILAALAEEVTPDEQ